MIKSNETNRIQSCIRNRLDRKAIGEKRIAGVIGDNPSAYSKSPLLWNAVFRALKMKAVYLPFDVDESQLPELVRALKDSDRVMGGSVTVPYKTKIMAYLDELDEKAKRIKAVNTIVRTDGGRLVGYNTDGKGLVESILAPSPGQERPFVQTLKGLDVLLIGAGGAARSVAFYLAEFLQGGTLLTCNRTSEVASSLAEEIRTVSGDAGAIREDEIPRVAPKVGLIINGSTKGQGGVRKTPDGKITTLEPYSALAPADPAELPESEYGKPEFYRNWLKASLADIEANNRASWNLALSIPSETRFCDLIYHPEETVFLRHGRLTGHRTLNGKGMLVAQAVDAFFKVCGAHFKKFHTPDPKRRNQITRLMYEAWSGG